MVSGSDDSAQYGSACREELESDWTFAPEKGNVLFVSAMDCWGTNVMKFANIYCQKKWKGGINKGVLLKYIFDDFCYDPTTKKLVKYNIHEGNGGLAWKYPLFVVMILEPLWNVYTKCTNGEIPVAIQYLKDEVCICHHTCFVSLNIFFNVLFAMYII